MAWDVVGGEDIYEVRARTHVAMKRARREYQPTLLEIQTYRYYGHSVADANAKKYRTPEEIEEYKSKHDPLRIWSKRLMDEGILDEAQADEMDQKAKAEANAAVKFAEESPYPETEDIFKDVYWEVDNQTDAAR